MYVFSFNYVNFVRYILMERTNDFSYKNVGLLISKELR
jgi:hypothetical protein